VPTESELLAQLNELVLKHPEEMRKVFADHPEYSVPVFTHLHKEQLAQKVREEDTPESFAAYCELMDGFAPPPHVMRQIRKVYKDHAAGIGTVLQASRGFRKTTYWGVKFIGYRTGKEPLNTHVSTGSNDDSATKVIDTVAAIIEFHPEWRRVFPNVVPDKQQGWSSDGYFVKDTSMPYEKWIPLRTKAVDPTMIGGGYMSKRINGKHPSGVLYIDDLHDVNNNSDIQRKAVVLALTTIILKTAIRVHDKLSTWILGIGVPWEEDDGYEVMKNAGYGYLGIPAMRRAVEGDEGAVYLDGRSPFKEGVIFDDLIGWWIFEWEEFGVNAIYQERGLGKYEFWQMIMLDIKTASTAGLKYYSYPHDNINYDFPTIGGCDPTTFEVDKLSKNKKASHFALCYGTKLPRGGAVISGGVLEQCSQLAAENYIIAAQGRFSNWMAVYVEDVSVGKMFRQTLLRNSKVKAPLPSGLKGISDGIVRSKTERIKEVSRWLEDATIRISDEDTTFLNGLRRLFDKFGDLNESDYAFDAGDAFFHTLRNMPDVCRIDNVSDDEFAEGRKKHTPHPLQNIGSYVGYGAKR
jgi:hypothetical protein